MMKKDFILIQAACCNCFWKIELGLNQASKMHVIFFINQSVEELFSHILDCFSTEQVRIEILDELLHLHFTQMVGNRQIKFTITLKQTEVNMYQIIQDLSAEIQQQSEKLILLEEELKMFRIQQISRILQDGEKDLVY